MNITKYNTERNRLILIILVAILIFGFCITGMKSHYIKVNEKEIAEYQYKIDSLKSDLKKSDIKIDSLNHELSNIDSLNSKVKSRIIYLKAKTNEKVDSVSNYTVNDINEFFSTRYKGQ